MYGWYGDGMGGGWGVFMVLMMLIFLVALIVGVVGLTRWNTNGHRGVAESAGSSALSILQERFARGEITEEEYRQRLGVLGRDR